ncbi:MAG: hypothetical protein QM731_09910 [Chitinophagaceae bacterium]
MKNKKISILFINLFSCVFVFNAKAQDDTSYVTAKIVRIDTIKYYVVIRVQTDKEPKQMTVLSPFDEKDEIIADKHDCVLVTTGKKYSFKLAPTSKIKIAKDKYLLISFKKYYSGDLLLLEEGEIPYVALNMYKCFIFKD